MKKVLLITSQFPYGRGEQFLETEVKYYDNLDVTIMPRIGSENIRSTSRNIKINNFLIENSFFHSKVTYLFKALKNNVFYRELFSEKFLNLKKMKIFLSSISIYQMYYELFNRYFSNIQDLKNLIVYTYWNDEVTYALESLKDKYNYKLISRIHGGDLYKERRIYNYMPLKKHFTKNIDTLYTITQSANSYLIDTYSVDDKILKLSRLGVDEKNIISRSSDKESLNIVSCSFLTEVKQVDKIIKSLKIIAIQMRDIRFSWTHVGDGILYDELLLLAKNELIDLDNVEYNFVGNYENEKVYEFYQENEVDVFINTSLSEGVPVSIMEAMSCHIPIVAPDVGGVRDMVLDKHNGFLLSEECIVDEIVNTLKNITFFKDDNIRENSYLIFLEKYNAKKKK